MNKQAPVTVEINPHVANAGRAIMAAGRFFGRHIQKAWPYLLTGIVVGGITFSG